MCKADRAAGEAVRHHLLSVAAIGPVRPLRVRDERNRAWHAIVEAVSELSRDPSAIPAVSRRRLLPDGAENSLEAERPMEAIRLLLRAAVDAGLAGRAVADRIGWLRDESSATGRAAETGAIEAVGGLRLKLDAAVALLEKAGRTVNRAVIRPTSSSVALAQVAAAGARILAAELASQAGVLRTRRVGRRNSVRSRYGLLAASYLNGVSAPPHHAPG